MKFKKLKFIPTYFGSYVIKSEQVIPTLVIIQTETKNQLEMEKLNDHKGKLIGAGVAGIVLSRITHWKFTSISYMQHLICCTCYI